MTPPDIVFIKVVIAFVLVAGTGMTGLWLWLRARARAGLTSASSSVPFARKTRSSERT